MIGGVRRLVRHYLLCLKQQDYSSASRNPTLRPPPVPVPHKPATMASRCLLLCLALVSAESAMAFLAGPPLVHNRGAAQSRSSVLSAKMQAEAGSNSRRAFLRAFPAILAASTVLGKDAHAEARSGAELFYRRCIECHGGGMNSIEPDKSLMKEALKKYDRYNKEAIVKIATTGEGKMPKFLGMVVDGRPYTTEELENVAEFILQNADSNWTKFGLR